MKDRHERRSCRSRARASPGKPVTVRKPTGLGGPKSTPGAAAPGAKTAILRQQLGHCRLKSDSESASHGGHGRKSEARRRSLRLSGPGPGGQGRSSCQASAKDSSSVDRSIRLGVIRDGPSQPAATGPGPERKARRARPGRWRAAREGGQEGVGGWKGERAWGKGGGGKGGERDREGGITF